MKYFTIIALILLSSATTLQNKNKILKVEILKGKFRILPSDWTKNNMCIDDYCSDKLFSMKNKAQIIEELLSFEGDTSICYLRTMNYNLKTSTLSGKFSSNYSIQVEALFMINQIIYKDPFNYAGLPVLIDYKTKKYENVNGPLIKLAFLSYKKWFKLSKRKSLDFMIKNKIDPLFGNNKYGWVR